MTFARLPCTLDMDNAGWNEAKRKTMSFTSGKLPSAADTTKKVLRTAKENSY